MQGSFDSPPIIITSSRIVSCVGLIVCGGLFFLGILHLSYPVATWTIEGYFMLISVGLGTLYFAMLLVKPSTLVIAPSGLTWSVQLGSRHWRWKDIDNFRAGPLGTIFCDMFDQDSKFGWLRPINKSIGGSHGALGFAWEGGAVAAAALLAEARTRWS